MSYEPRGKVGELVAAMRAPGAIPVWSSAECAAVMGIMTTNLPAYIDAAVKNGAVHRRMENGRCYFSLQPFAAEEARPATVLEIPTMSVPGWKPPKMTAPRGEAAPRVILRDPLPKPIPAPVPAPAPIVVAAPPSPPAQPLETEEPEPEDEEAVAFNAALWADGDLCLFGLVELEGGGHKVNAENVPALRKLLMGAPC